jgi:4,4-dimethyl-9beta,19-cyclopropylsterol-4alpha-methyl oxidase
MAIQLATFFIIEDYGNYWLHRWLHTEWAYRKIHWKHHEFTTPMSFAASYAHPLEILILGIPSFVGPAIVRCHVITLWAWIVLRQWEAVETHSGSVRCALPSRLSRHSVGSNFRGLVLHSWSCFWN